MPKISAAANRFLLLTCSTMVRPHLNLRELWAGVSLLAIVACTEPTTSVRSFAVLDDAGQDDWAVASVGGDHTCGIKSNGAAYCWGDNRFGQLGVARFDTTCGTGDAKFGCSIRPAAVQPGVQFAAISAGARHTCAITASREAYCWGANDQGQVADFAIGGPTLVRVPGALGWAQISAGATHTCAVRTDGVVFCWGGNDRGQLGVGTLTSSGGIVRVSIAAPIATVSAGQQRTCARTTTGTVYCWGAVWTDDRDGLENTRVQSTPQLVPGAPSMASVSVGTFATCGTDRSGFAYCWEANPRGQMGTGTQDGSTTPLRVATDLEFLQVSSGIAQSCGIVTSGAAYCWGDDSFGQLGVSPSLLTESCGDQRLPCSTKPFPVFGREQFTEISTGFGSHSCGVTTRGNLYCWGLGLSGQRGDGTENYAISVPVRVDEPLVR